jgi:hypothetical protein
MVQILKAPHMLPALPVGAVGLLVLFVLARLRFRENSRRPNSGRQDEKKSLLIDEPRMKEREIMQPEPNKKYTKPKIILIDLDPVACAALSDVGYLPVEASLGRPYSVTAGNGFCRVIANGARVPGLMEMEVLVIDLEPPEPREPREPAGPPSAPGWWAKQTEGVVDPRPTTMNTFKD